MSPFGGNRRWVLALFWIISLTACAYAEPPAPAEHAPALSVSLIRVTRPQERLKDDTIIQIELDLRCEDAGRQIYIDTPVQVVKFTDQDGRNRSGAQFSSVASNSKAWLGTFRSKGIGQSSLVRLRGGEVRGASISAIRELELRMIVREVVATADIDFPSLAIDKPTPLGHGLVVEFLELSADGGSTGVVLDFARGNVPAGEVRAFTPFPLAISAIDAKGELLDRVRIWNASPEHNQRFKTPRPIGTLRLSVATEVREHLLTLTARDCRVSIPLADRVTSLDPAGLRAELDAGTPIEEVGESGATPLVAALSAHRTDLAEVLLDRGASVSAGGSAPLGVAVLWGSPLVARLLDAGADPNAAPDGVTSSTATAASVGPAETLQLLLDRGGNPFFVGRSGSLLDAARLSAEIGTPLVRGPTYHLLTPIYAGAILNGGRGEETARKSEITRLMAASYRGDIETVRAELDVAGNPARIDSGRWTALHWAADAPEDRTEVLRLLIAAGLPIDAEDRAGRTALCVASSVGNEAAVRALLSAGAKTKPRSPENVFPLGVAARFGHEAIARMLIDAKPDQEMLDASAWRSVDGRQHDVLRLLLAAGANPNAKGMNGTVLILNHAVRSGSLELARVLLDGGADPSTPDGFLWAPLVLAAGGDNLEMFNLVFSHPRTQAQLGAIRDGLRLIDRAYGSARAQRREAIMRKLLEAGANPDAESEQEKR